MYTTHAPAHNTHTVPTAIVSLSSVERTPDNTTLVVAWENVITSLPTGDIATYEIEYRDAGQITSNFGIVPENLNFFVLTGLADANDYEVHVYVISIHVCTLGSRPTCRSYTYM